MYSNAEISPSPEGCLFHSTLELVDEARKIVRSDQADTEDEVHRIRIILKILRSRQQLIRPHVHPNSYRSANQRIKSAATELAGRRDGDVLLKTHAKLLKKTSGKKTGKSMKALMPLLEQVKEVALEPIDWKTVEKRLDAESTFWKRQSGNKALASQDAIILGLRITYGKARKRFGTAYAEKDLHLFHDWRKWTKHLLYQLRFLETMGCEKLKKREQVLSKLSKLLGNHHDLHVYRQHIHQVSAKDFSSDQLARCDVRIRQCEKSLENQCKVFARAGFEEKPSEFEAFIRKNWQSIIKLPVASDMTSF
jgi:CHAD domain-containing protein